MTKQAKTTLTLTLDDDLIPIDFQVDSNLPEPDRRRIILDAYVGLADKSGLGFGDMVGELMNEAKAMQNGRRKRE
ncbi:hypothetical protein [Levilactobacillus humaensis]|uniref:hypothetical protein n=1 Tax=Levilactobacillus humaensis TaxID=2950375 RepID=UPI0021C2DB2C|nr:hypothetical protein [Levilactobacillus humaensis]